MSVTIKQYESDLGDIWQTAQQELWQATSLFLDDVWVALENRVSWSGLLSPVSLLEDITLDLVGAFINYADNLTEIPIRTLTRVGALAVPVRKDLQNRVMTAGDAYRFVATEIVESALDLFGGRTLPVAWKTYKSADRALTELRLFKAFDLSDVLKLLKGTFISRIIRIITLTFQVATALAVIAILWALFSRANDADLDTDLPTLSQDSKRVWGGKRRQHRVNRVKGPDVGKSN